MITIDDILKSGALRRGGTSDHKHALESRVFNVEGHRVRGKVCTKCGERFFLMEDLVPLDAEIQARKKGQKVISAEDAVLLLAGTYEDVPIPGRLVIQKEVFLFEKSFAPEHNLHVETFVFRPFKMGPFSQKLSQLLEDMERRGLIASRPLTGREGTAYVLAQRGRQAAARKRKEINPAIWESLRKKRRAWDELGSRGLLRLVYQDFSAYAGKSEIRDEVEEDHWDEGRTLPRPRD